MAARPVTALVRLPVRRPADVEQARRAARSLTRHLGFAAAECEAVVLATSELATNLARYARDGVIILRAVAGAGGGVEVESRDRGPGIADLATALTDGVSTGGGLGNGLPAVRRLMDTFAVTTGPDGTTIVAGKWRPPAS